LIVYVLALLAAFIQPVQALPSGSLPAQGTEPPLQVRQLFNAMTPEERVGQLFLVTLSGTQADDTSAIYDLIVNYHVGGVVLLAPNDNFTDAPNTLTDAHNLIANLQEIERLNSTKQVLNIETGRLGSPSYVPLWVGISQDGNGAPTDQILNGLTPLPSEMALGATWDVSLAEEVGATLGRELSALGFNFYFGPSLDVLDQPSPLSNRDLGTRAFGGDPFWVGEMGRAYIHGLHRGSANRLMVIAKHFPGRGSSDRLPEDEVATVRKSLEQLKQVELVPFFAVTGNSPDAPSMADGVLVSHIRYQGFQNNIRVTTRPFSFDSAAMGEILNLPQLSTWYQSGGLIVSDDLGSHAVHNFYAPGASLFNSRLIVRDAFLAGNDLLYLGNIYTTDPADHNSTVKQILNYFAQRYSEDTAFAQRVDAAALRILTRKYQTYGDFNEARVTPDIVQLSRIGVSDQIAFQVANRAATLISPDRSELDSVLPDPPASSDYIVFLTDSSVAKQCSLCLEQPVLAVDALQEAVLRLYGPSAGGQAFASRLSSYSFTDVANLLNGTPPENMENNLRRASWVVISIKDSSASQPELIQRFLAERQDLLRSQKVILFSFGAPYYFDSTDIAKLTAYFAFYGKSPAFVDVAARTLYREFSPQGHSPVSIPGSGYDLIDVTAPEPTQIISLFLDLPAAPVSTDSPSQTPEPTPMPSFKIGDAVTVRTGTILDHNGNPVPDGTVVHFIASIGGESALQQDAFTAGGSAVTSFRIEKPGLLEIRAASDPATISAVLQLPVVEGAAAVVTVIVPVLTETVAPPTPTPTPTVESDFVTPDGAPRFSGWMLSLFILGGGTVLAYWIGSSAGKTRWGVRWALCALVGGLFVYNYLALGLPGAADALQSGDGGALVGLVLIGQMLGALGAWVWMLRKK
jgi:beta-N-acetylhexosaminidase